jgi:hypothetical protein
MMWGSIMKRGSELVVVGLVSQILLTSAISQGIDDGEAVRCVSLSRIDHTEVIDDSHIAFYMRGGDIFVNQLNRICPRLERERRFSYQVSTGQLCSIDAITVLTNFGGVLSRGASCSLGMFLPADEDLIAALKGDEEPAEIIIEDIEIEAEAEE